VSGRFASSNHSIAGWNDIVDAGEIASNFHPGSSSNRLASISVAALTGTAKSDDAVVGGRRNHRLMWENMSRLHRGIANGAHSCVKRNLVSIA